MKNKIIFWIDGLLLDFCIANSLQKKTESKLYAIIDITNKPKSFFQNQQFVNFEKVWFYHDHINKMNKKPDISYLSLFEKKHKIDLWKLAINERIFYRFNRLYKFKTNEILSILEQECKFFERILDEIKPDFLITYDPPLHHHKLFYDLCISKGIKVLGLFITRVGSKCIIAQDGKTLDLDIKSQNFKTQNKSFDELKNQIKSNYSNIIKNYLKGRDTTQNDKIKAVIDYVLKSDSTNVKTHYSYYGRSKHRVLIDAIKFLMKKNYRKKFIDKNLKTDIDYKVPYIFMPLAVDEEMNLLHYAPYYTNQIEIIRHIVKSIPVDYQLYVKEHPGEEVRGWRSISEYKEITEIPNVTLIHPSVNSEKLFQSCSLVITVRGTSGLDATFYGKPTVIFGDISYSILPSVYRVRILEELPDIIKNALNTKVQTLDLENYLSLITQNSFDFDFLGFENLRDEYFYSGKILSDVEIPQEKMRSFLNEHKLEFDKLATEYLKKIENYNKINK